MDIINRFIQKITGLLKPAPVQPGQLQASPLMGVNDGVDYLQPFVLPGYTRREMKRNATLATAVQESMARYHTAFGDPYKSNIDAPMTPPTEDPLREWDFATRERVLSTCHAVYARNPLANSIVQFTTQFVVGDGFNLTCKNKDVERILNAFIENPDNAVREYERQAVNDLQVDGELFLRFFGEGEEMVMVPYRPWEIEYIKTEQGFFRRPISYTYQPYETEGDDPGGETNSERINIPAKEMLHVAINRHAYELRGRPELYRLLPWLHADKEFLSDRVVQSKWRGALLFHVAIAGATPAIVAAIGRRWAKPPTPGSAYVSTDKETVTPITNNTNAGDASNDGRAIRLMNIMGARLPEYFFADGQNANLATAKKQELPALTKFEAYQQIMIEQVWMPVFKRVIQAAIDEGKLPEECEVHDADGETVEIEQPREMMPNMRPTPPDAETSPDDPDAPAEYEMCKTIEAFEVAYEPVTGDDLATLATAYTTMKNNGWVSDKTAQEKLGLDPRQEDKRMKAEKMDAMDEIASGLAPLPPGQIPPPGMDTDALQQPANNPNFGRGANPPRTDD